MTRQQASAVSCRTSVEASDHHLTLSVLNSLHRWCSQFTSVNGFEDRYAYISYNKQCLFRELNFPQKRIVQKDSKRRSHESEILIVGRLLGSVLLE